MTFDSVVGQAALTTTLKNAVKSGRLAHAYLFCGPRGVGKTTCARIFAKAINCQTPTPDGEACGECESCQSFNEQRSLNIFELDAASNNSVEHIKTLMEQTRIPPQVGKYKVFIIDEVHMLSTAAFNAFLKTLEEPPAHVIFILATTEKHKILPTILSRCQIYDFERMTVQNTISHLKGVAEKEGIKYEEQALAVIAEKADGGMRDALSIFDQAASFCQGNITYQKVIEDLNVLDSEYYFRMIDLALENKVAEVMVLVGDVLSKGFDGGLMVQGLAKHVRNVLMAKDVQTLPLLEVSEQMAERYKAQAQRTPTPFLYGALKLMNQCDLGYKQSSNKRLLVELTLIEMAQLTQPDADAGAGRKPRRLKNLFKKMMDSQRQQKPLERKSAQPEVKSAPQVAAAVTKNETKPTSETKLKIGGITNSWGNLKQQATPKKLMLPPGVQVPGVKVVNEVREFTQDELELQWMSMCNRMPQKLSGIAARMKNMNPVIKQMPEVELTVPNEIIKAEIDTIKGSIVATLKAYLHNTNITFTIKVAEHDEHQKILTRREQFELMASKNALLEKLRVALDLELA
jgi:DNA polymerase-3 subunit gamma/tau